MNAREAVAAINAAKLESPSDAKWEVDGLAKVATIDTEEHRWYVVGTIVYRLGDEFIGVSGVVSVKSESMSVKDCEVEVTAFEMEQVPTVTYRPKQ